MPVTFVSIALAWGLLSGAVTGVAAAATTEQAAPEVTIQVTIKKMEFHVTGYGREGNPTAIVVRNEDGVTHGFYSPLFKDTPVRLEGDGYQVAGKDVPSFRVDPGKTMTLHFTKGSAEAPLTMMSPLMRHVIWCDMHPDVKGELFIIERKPCLEPLQLGQATGVIGRHGRLMRVRQHHACADKHGRTQRERSEEDEQSLLHGEVIVA